MRKLFLLPLAILPLYAGASCQDSIVSDKYILFIDTNDSFREIDTAEKAACARGEKMIIVPKDHKEYQPYINKVADAEYAVKKCGLKHKKEDASIKCTTERLAVDSVKSELTQFKRTKPTMEAATSAGLKEIRAQKGKMSNIIISGHNGGGTFSGYKGEFNKEFLRQIIGDYKDINEVKSLMLLGCYTGVQKEIIDWKNILPDVKIISGYDGRAPLSDKPFGHQYITELLTKEKGLLESANQEDLKKFSSENVKSLGQLNSAVYCEGNDGKEYYYTSKNKINGFSLYGGKSCEQQAVEYDSIIADMSAYFSGEKEPPSDTVEGEIRQLYIKARNLEHCEVFLKKEININAIFNLLFYQGVKKSFAAFYKDDLEKADKALQEMITNFPNLVKGIWVPTSENLDKRSRKEMLDNIHNIHGLLTQEGLTRDQKNVLAWVADVSTHHLQHFQNPFSWHEFESGIPEKPSQVLKLNNYGWGYEVRFRDWNGDTIYEEAGPGFWNWVRGLTR